jgi:hypothetical protein
MSYLTFNKQPREKGRKTDWWLIVSANSAQTLGRVMFYPHWRKFVFESTPGCVFDADCLQEIAIFTRAQTGYWRADHS